MQKLIHFYFISFLLYWKTKAISDCRQEEMSSTLLHWGQQQPAKSSSWDSYWHRGHSSRMASICWSNSKICVVWLHWSTALVFWSTVGGRALWQAISTVIAWLLMKHALVQWLFFKCSYKNFNLVTDPTVPTREGKAVIVRKRVGIMWAKLVGEGKDKGGCRKVLIWLW